MLQLQAFVLSANQPLKRLASCSSLFTQSTSQTQMKHSRKTSLCHLEQASIQDPMHKGCAAISQYSSIVLSVVKSALLATFAMKPLPIPIRLCAGLSCTRIDLCLQPMQPWFATFATDGSQRSISDAENQINPYTISVTFLKLHLLLSGIGHFFHLLGATTESSMHSMNWTKL